MKNHTPLSITIPIAIQASDFLRSSWMIRVGLLFTISLLLMMKFAFAEISDSGNLKFDHSKTGFILSGSHVQARCASCHVSGVFKGTPRDCSSCHVAGNHMGAQAKTTKHITTVAQCDSCHQNTTWIPATFRHVGLPDGTCQNCHNGTAATGKPSGHIATTDSCDTCHKTVDWKQLAAGGMPANHLPTTQPCSTCHKQASLVPGTMSHSGIISGCTSCHNGQSFTGVTPKSKPTNHIPTSMPCETCHSPTNFTSFLLPTSIAMMNHVGIVNGCTTCHNGQAFAGVTPKSKLDASPTHMTTSLDCSSCHTSTMTFAVASLTTPPVGHLPTAQPCSTCHGSGASFLPGNMTHTGIVSGCTSCHNGQAFTGVTPKSKPVNHVPTSMSCETCHSTSNTSTGGFSGTVMKHTGIVGGCTNCHNGQAFAGVTPVFKPMGTPAHLNTSLSCETCHSSTVSFTGAGMNHLGIVSGCINCHTGQTFAVGMTPLTKSSSHVVTSSPCENCHKSTTSFLNAAAAMPTNHLPTTQPCSICHTSGFGTGSGLPMNHLGISSGCTTCHNGQAFYGVTPKSKPTNHLPTSASCETCHVTNSTGTGGFGPNTPMKHTGIVGGCTNCHNGQAFAGVTPVAKPTNHLPTTMSCETCHSSTMFTVFSGTAMKHTGIVNGCATCHDMGKSYYGVAVVTKLSNHLPTTRSCETCHSSSNFSMFSGTAMNHTGILTNCKQCHYAGSPASFQGVSPVSTSFYTGHVAVGAQDCSACHTSTVSFYTQGGTMPTNHIPTTQVCTTCHTSGFGGGSGLPMNHLGIVSGCTSCHNGQAFFGVTPVSKPVNHLPTSSSCETCHSSTKFAQPGGFSGTAMNHVGIVSGCTNCHNGQTFAGVTQVSKGGNHLPTTLPCETCHAASKFSTFSGTLMNHSGIVNNCTQCHNSQAFQGVAPVSKSVKHIPYATTLIGGASMQCEFCHSKTVFTSFMTGLVSSTTMHNGTTGGGACFTCHRSGGGWSASNMETKTHNSTSLSKDCSSSGCHRPLGNTGSTYTSWK
jgi:hypothetical protein